MLPSDLYLLHPSVRAVTISPSNHSFLITTHHYSSLIIFGCCISPYVTGHSWVYLPKPGWLRAKAKFLVDLRYLRAKALARCEAQRGGAAGPWMGPGWCRWNMGMVHGMVVKQITGNFLGDNHPRLVGNTLVDDGRPGVRSFDPPYEVSG